MARYSSICASFFFNPMLFYRSGYSTRSVGTERASIGRGKARRDGQKDRGTEENGGETPSSNPTKRADAPTLLLVRQQLCISTEWPSPWFLCLCGLRPGLDVASQTLAPPNAEHPQSGFMPCTSGSLPAVPGLEVFLTAFLTNGLQSRFLSVRSVWDHPYQK